MPDQRAQDVPSQESADFSPPNWQNVGDDQISQMSEPMPGQPQQPPFAPEQPVQPYPQSATQPELRIEEQPEIPQFQQLNQQPSSSQEQYAPEQFQQPQYEPPFDAQQGFDPNQQPPEEQFSEQEAYDQQAYQQQAYAPQYGAMPVQPEPEYLLMEWIADSRVTWRRSKEYYSSLAVIVLLISLILFFAGQTLLIFVVLAFLFITYVLSTVRAESIPHQFTTYGLRYRGEKLIYWTEMVRFWVKDNHGIPEIHIEAPGEFMNELILLPSNAQSPVEVTAEDMIDLLSRYLPFEEPLPSQLDRWVTWIQEKFPLE